MAGSAPLLWLCLGRDKQLVKEEAEEELRRREVEQGGSMATNVPLQAVLQVSAALWLSWLSLWLCSLGYPDFKLCFSKVLMGRLIIQRGTRLFWIGRCTMVVLLTRRFERDVQTESPAHECSAPDMFVYQQQACPSKVLAS